MTDRIERELLLSACPTEVWQTLTDRERLEQWLADEVSLELRPGGEASFRFGDQLREGWVEEARPPKGDSACGRLAFWWAGAEEPATRVELTLAPLPGGGTRVRVVESRPLELLDLLGTPLPGLGGSAYGPALVAAAA